MSRLGVAKDRAGLVNTLDRVWARQNVGVVWRHYRRMNELLEVEEESDDPMVAATAEHRRAHNAANAVLFVCANVEEILWVLWQKVASGEELGGRGGLERFKPALGTHGLGLDLGQAEWWEALLDAFTVRDCLLHGNGRLALLKTSKRATMDRILEREGSGLWVEHDRVQVGDLFVRRTVNAAVAMVEAMHRTQEELAQAAEEE